jgi:hypothetical protein
MSENQINNELNNQTLSEKDALLQLQLTSPLSKESLARLRKLILDEELAKYKENIKRGKNNGKN